MVYRNISKEYVVERLKSVAKLGWIKNHNSNNAGGVGNTIASMLGLPSDNLPIADTAQWELKSHKIGSSSLVTLLHLEPEPRESRVVAKLLLPKYGWPDQSRPNEISFRQTIQAQHPSDRGFKVSIDTQNEKVSIVFDSAAVDQRHSNWLEQVNSKAGLGPINPQPYWNFQQLFLKAQTKLLNTFYVEVDSKREGQDEYFKIAKISILQSFSIDKFIDGVAQGAVLVDFDARTHHNHGTKFRLRSDFFPNLYRYKDIVLLSE